MNAIPLNEIKSNPRKYWPMRIVGGENSAGFRIGGLPPAGVRPKKVCESTHYFGTFPVADGPGEELSIFTSINCSDVNHPFFITNNINILLDQNSGIIECIFHKPSKRAEGPDFASELCGYAVSAGAEALSDPEKPAAPHMIGGLPFFYPKQRAALDELDPGYVHLLQWCCPGFGDCSVKGRWPFHDYRFNLYLKSSKDAYDFKAILV